jgi:hypothetical protein
MTNDQRPTIAAALNDLGEAAAALRAATDIGDPPVYGWEDFQRDAPVLEATFKDLGYSLNALAWAFDQVGEQYDRDTLKTLYRGLHELLGELRARLPEDDDQEHDEDGGEE